MTNRYLYPDQYTSEMRARRRRRTSTWKIAEQKEVEEDSMQSYKKGMASRSKTVELSGNDYKNVEYLKQILTREEHPEPKYSLADYTFDESKFAPLKVGTLPYEPYNPPAIHLDASYVDRFSAYFDLFSGKGMEPVTPEWTLHSALAYVKSQKPTEDASPSGGLSAEMIRACPTTCEEDGFDMTLSVHKESRPFLENNLKSYKTTGQGLPNALGVSSSYLCIGMNTSPILCYPRAGGAPFTFGHHENASTAGSVLSLSVDLSEQFLAAGFSTGALELFSLERRQAVKSLPAHSTAVLFARFLSSGSLLSLDYAGSLQLTTLSRKLFAVTANATLVAQLDRPQDCAILSFAWRNGAIGRNVDLLAVTTPEFTQIFDLQGSRLALVATLPREKTECSRENPRFDAKTGMVQRFTCSDWFRGDDHALYIRGDDTLLESWTIEVGVSREFHLDDGGCDGTVELSGDAGSGDSVFCANCGSCGSVATVWGGDGGARGIRGGGLGGRHCAGVSAGGEIASDLRQRQ